MNETRRISSWTDLAKWLESYREQGWIFRGEPDASYEALKPKAGRVSRKTGSPRKTPYTLRDEQRAFDEFKKLARPYLTSFEPRSEIAWLSIAQHHGLPTRLLDWTGNLFVAAFFAVELAGKRHGVIYCIRGLDEIVDEDAASADFFALDAVKVYRPPALSPRVVAQQSVFTVHPRPDEEFSDPRLERWLIEADACWKIKRALSAAGVNLAALFPDMDGLCKHLGWLYKWSYFDRLSEVVRT